MKKNVNFQMWNSDLESLGFFWQPWSPAVLRVHLHVGHFEFY